MRSQPPCEIFSNQMHCPAQILTLESGLTVIHQWIPTTPVVVTDVWVRAGAIAEPVGWWGMAHFLEHMIFKGSKQVLPGEFDQVLETRGGTGNAATSYDYAHFFMTTARDHLGETLPYFGNILLQAEIPDEEFLQERKVVLEEIRATDDDPDWLAFQALNELLYQTHPYGRSILGINEDLLRHTANQMRCFHRTHYQPNLMTVVMVGNIELEPALDFIHHAFDPFSVPSECPPLPVLEILPLPAIVRGELFRPNLEVSRLLMGWVGPSANCMQDAIALDLLAVIIAGSYSSYLVQELREKRQWVLDITSCFSLQRDSSLFTVEVWLEEEYMTDVEKVIGDRLNLLHHQLISTTELCRAQAILSNDYIFSTETAAQLAHLYGHYHNLSQVHHALQYPQWIQQTTPQDLQRVARQYLCCDRYGIISLKPP